MSEIQQQQPSVCDAVDKILQACQNLLTEVDSAHVRAQRDLLIQHRLYRPETFAMVEAEDLVSRFGLTREAAAALKLVYPSTGGC